jgi:predicted CoA-binding protein
MQEDKPEPTTMKQIIADAIRLRVVTVSRDQSKYAAEDVLAQLKKAGYELRKK